MNWIEVFIETTADAIEPVSGILYEVGLTGLMIEDERDFKEFLQNPSREWDYVGEELEIVKRTGITFYVSDNPSGMDMLSAVESGLKDLKERVRDFDFGSLSVTMKNVKDEDWANNWKKYFKPLPVGDKIIIKPSWEQLSENTDKIILKIDPGHIFGTGTHETTQLCMELIENYVKKGDTILDIGCGSGILSISSILLGAEKADAVDIDPNAVDIAYENASMNDIKNDRYTVFAGNVLESQELKNKFSNERYDVVEANIVADIIIELLNDIPSYIKKDGIFICSGIIKERLDDVQNSLNKKGFEILEIKTKKDWVAVASKYRG